MSRIFITRHDGRTVDTGLQDAEQADLKAGAKRGITLEHSEVHRGNHFNHCNYRLDLNSGQVKDLVMTTPDTKEKVHLIFNAYSTEGALLELFEGASGISGGSDLTPRNNNRNSTNTSGATLLEDPTIDTVGTPASKYIVGAKKNAGFYKRDREFVLKPNTSYILRLTSRVTGNDISWCVEWYEKEDLI